MVLNYHMLKAFVDRFVPASLYGGESAFSEVSALDRDMRQCVRAAAAVDVLERAKPDVYRRLRSRFDAPSAQALTIKLLNIFLARYHFESRSARLLSRPFGLVIDPSNACQLACPGCVHSARSEEQHAFDWPIGTLSGSRYAELLKLYGPYTIEVYFCNYGEPLLNLNTPKLIRMAKRYLIRTALSTSLSVKRFDAGAYVEAGLDFMVLSIDGATQPVYEQFRRNGNLELVLDNVRKLVDAKRKLGKRTPVLSWNFLAFEHNAHEIPEAMRLARQLGINQFRVVNPFDVSRDDPGIRLAEVKPGVRRLDWFSTTSAPENWNPFPDEVDADTIASAFERPWNVEAADDAAPDAGHTCNWLYKNMVMDATGRIMPCCGAPRPDANLVFAKFDGGIADPFNSEKYREARASLAGIAPASSDPPYCTACEWDHTAENVGAWQIRNYFRMADAALFDRRSLKVLSGW